MASFVETKAESICNLYWKKCEESYIVRAGTVACGLFNDTGLDKEADNYLDFLEKPELVAEHAGRAALLYGLIELYNAENPAYRTNYRLDFQKMIFMLLHDTPEIKRGDQLDDGSSSHEESRPIELEEVHKIAGDLPLGNRDLYLLHSSDFEDYTGIGVDTKLADKMDAVLYQLFIYQKYGRIGDVRKKNPPSERDLRFAKILKTYSAPDVWTLHYRVVTKHMPSSATMLQDAVMREAFLRSYHTVPKCMTIDVTNIELDEPKEVAS